MSIHLSLWDFCQPNRRSLHVECGGCVRRTNSKNSLKLGMVNLDGGNSPRKMISGRQKTRGKHMWHAEYIGNGHPFVKKIQ